MIYRRAIRNGEVTVNPCSNLDLPAVRGRRERIPSPQEAVALLAALPESDRALWATALYARALRRGELLALQWDDVDLAKGVIRVRRAMDARGSIISPKSAAGIRAVPVAKVLRAYLAAHRLRNSSAHYVFGSGDRPFVPTAVSKRAEKAWTAADLTPIGLHDARHAAASLLIAAGVNVKALATYMGHGVYHDHARSLRPPVLRQRGRGCSTRRRVSRSAWKSGQRSERGLLGRVRAVRRRSGIAVVVAVMATKCQPSGAGRGCARSGFGGSVEIAPGFGSKGSP